MKREKKRNRYEEQKERREREQREKEARERREAEQRRRTEQIGTGNARTGKSTSRTAKKQADVAPTWVNTAGPGGGAELWKQVKLEPGETAADYYEKKRKQREADRQKTDAAFSRALEETQKELREQRLGVAEGFGRKKRYNRNYEDLFGLPEGGDFRSRVEGTRGWDKLNGSEQYDRMVYIQEELERRKKEREKEEEIGYNTVNGRNKQRDVWNGQRPPRTMEHRAAEAEPQRKAGRETPGAVWSSPAIVRRPEEIPEDVWNGLDWRGRLSAAGRIEGAKQREAWIAGEREAANQPTTGRAGAELLMADVNEAQATRKKEGETEEAPLFFPGGREEMLEYLREHPDATLPNGMSGRMVAEADKIVGQPSIQEADPNSKEIQSDSPSESKGNIPPAYTRQEVDELRKLLEEEGEIQLSELEGTPYMRAINELVRNSDAGGGFSNDIYTANLETALLSEGITFNSFKDSFTQEHLDALINYNKRMYDKLGAPMEEDKLASGMSDGMDIIDAIKDPFALIGLASKAIHDLATPDEYKGRDSYEED